MAARPFFRIKKSFEKYMALHQKMSFGSMYFRPYQPGQDIVVSMYSESDWKLIFENTTEEDLIDMAGCQDILVLLWCDAATDKAHGMFYIEESKHRSGEVFFHGGTWNHDSKYFVNIFSSIIGIFSFLLSIDAHIMVTCKIGNVQADKFQNGLCFVEIDRTKSLIIKELNKEKFIKSALFNRERHLQSFL